MKRLALVIGLVTGFAGALSAQPAPKDFFLSPPVGSIAFRLGYMGSDANSDVFDFSLERFNVHKRDFGGVNGEAELAFVLYRGFEMSVAGGYAVASKRSMYRDWVDNDDQPIEQTTWFRRVPLTINLRYNLAKSVQPIGSFAFIPNTFTPYVGLGTGLVAHKFKQTGDFIDFQDMSVFFHQYESTGVSSLVQAVAGLTYAANARMGLDTQLKYVRSSAQMGAQWIGFDNIDLSGVALTTGMHIRF
jgi:hypothetical protein